MQKSKLLVAVLGALVAMPALADSSPFSANVSLVSDYLYRGISQTGHKPAIQGGFNYNNPNGLYAGVWGSSISWISDTYTATGGASGANNAGLELDTFFGYSSSFATDFTYDVGYLRYNYPGTYPAGATKADTDELHAALGYKWITAKYSYSLGKTFGVPDASGTSYFELNGAFPLADDFALSAHAGKQTYKGSSAAYVAAGGPSATYTDYNVGVTKTVSGYVFGLTYSKTNASTLPGAFYTVNGKELGKGTAVLSVSRTF